MIAGALFRSHGSHLPRAKPAEPQRPFTMSTKDDYTPEEWQLLFDIPPMVGTAVMVAGRSGLGSLKEAFALASGVLSGKHGYEDNQLIQSLIESRLKEGQRSQVESLTDNPYRSKQPSELVDEVAKKCSQASHLLSEKSTVQEAGSYKQWVLEVGQKVAEAAKEGGFLGVGGQRVSAAEQEVLDKLTAALS